MKRYTILIALISVALAGCDKNVPTPSYLRIDAMKVVDNPSDSWSQDQGFFTSRIDAVNVVLWAEGDTAETELGTFTLPCEIPVLREGNIDYIRILPVVKQDGKAWTRIYYPYYEMVNINDVRLTADSVTDLDTLRTRYISKNLMKVLWQEYFEPGPGDISIDSTVTRCYAPDSVCSGYGSGVVRVKSSDAAVHFWADTTFYVPNPGTILYLEMDYWSDIDFSVGLFNPTYEQGPNQLISKMTIYGRPENGWRKIYINIGSIWSGECNHYPRIRPYFTVLNNSGKEGNVFIDNIKLLAM